MKKWLLILTASLFAVCLSACDPSNLTPEEMEMLSTAMTALSDDWENGDLPERLDEFASNLHPEVLDPANLHWERLTTEDYAALGLDMEDLEEAGLVLESLPLDEVDVSDLDITTLNLADLVPLGVGDLTLADLNVEINLDDLDLTPEQLFTLFSSLSDEDLKAIGLEGLDFTSPRFGDFDPDDLNVDALLTFLSRNGIDPVEMVMASIDPKAIDLNNPAIRSYILSQLEAEGIDLKGLGIDPDKLDLNAIDLEALGIDLKKLDLNAFDVGALDLTSIDLEKLGIRLEDLNLNHPMIRDFIDDALKEEGIDLEDYGISLDEIDLNNPVIKKLLLGGLDDNGFDLANLDEEEITEILEELDLEDLGLEMGDLGLVFGDLDLEPADLQEIAAALVSLDLGDLDLDDLGIDPADLSLEDLDLSTFDPENLDPEVFEEILENLDPSDLNLDSPLVQDFLLTEITITDLDLDDIDLGALPLEDLGLEELEMLNLDDVEVIELELSDEDLEMIEEEISNLDLDDFDYSELTIGDLAALGITGEDLVDAGLVPQDLMNDIYVLFEGIAGFAGYTSDTQTQALTTEKASGKDEDAEKEDGKDQAKDKKDEKAEEELKEDLAEEIEANGELGELEQVLADAMDELAQADPDSAQYRVGALSETLLDMDARNEAGADPIKDWIKAYERADDLDDLLKADLSYMNDSMMSGVNWMEPSYGIDDPDQTLIAIDTMLHGPRQDILVDAQEDLDDARDAYLVYLGETFRGAGFDMVDSVLKGASVYALQTEYEEHALSNDEILDASEEDALYTQEELEKEFPNLPFAQWLEAMGLDGVSDDPIYYVYDPEGLAFLNSIYDEEHFEMLRDNAIQAVISTYETVLDEKLLESSKKLSEALYDTPDMESLEDTVATQVCALLPTDVDQLFTEDYDVSDYSREWLDELENADVLSAEDGGTAFENALNLLLAQRRFEFGEIGK